MFSVCLSPEGYLSQVPSPFPRLWSQVLSGGTPVSGPMSLLGGYPNLWSHVLSGVPQSLVPCPFWGYPRAGVPPARTGVPPSQNWGTPQPGLDTPQPGLGYSPFPYRLCCRWYALCGFPRENFLVAFCVRCVYASRDWIHVRSDTIIWKKI